MNPSKLRFSFGASLQRACSFAVVDKIMQIRLTGLSSVHLKRGESAPKLVHLLRSFKEGMRKQVPDTWYSQAYKRIQETGGPGTWVFS